MNEFFKNYDGGESNDIDLDQIQDFVNAEGMGGGLVANESLRESTFKSQSGLGYNFGLNTGLNQTTASDIFDTPEFEIDSSLPMTLGGSPTLNLQNLPSGSGNLNLQNLGTNTTGSAAELCKKRSFRKKYPALCGLTQDDKKFGEGLGNFAEGIQKGLGTLTGGQNANNQQAGMGNILTALLGNQQPTGQQTLPCADHGYAGCASMGTAATCQQACTRKVGGGWVVPTIIGLIGIGIIVIAVNSNKGKKVVVSAPESMPTPPIAS